MSARKVHAFTLVELLVVISIIGMLMALVLPAVQQSKETARTVVCANHLKELALGATQFESDYRRFPGYVNSVGPDNKKVSWAVVLLPYVSHQDLWAYWSRLNYGKIPTPASVGIELFQCPSNPPTDSAYGALVYVVNAGYYGDTPRQENPANGVFFHHYPNPDGPFDPSQAVTTSLAYLASNDGASNTAMMSENIQRHWFLATSDSSGCPAYTDSWATISTQKREVHGFIWYDSVDDGSSPKPGRQINLEKEREQDVQVDTHVRPSAYHPQGVNIAFCDGHVKFVAQTIEYGMYRQMMTPAGGYSSDANNANFPFDDTRL